MPLNFAAQLTTGVESTGSASTSIVESSGDPKVPLFSNREMGVQGSDLTATYKQEPRKLSPLAHNRIRPLLKIIFV
jgi:hypothetical protein